jgi:AcrR family transcriptional regulator
MISIYILQLDNNFLVSMRNSTMSEKKQGRRSAQEAEETKCHILSVAGRMFCELGYERVSLRNISEDAGISHSLIRYHFGSKEKIWYAVNDVLHIFISEYMQQLADDLPQEKSIGVQFYQFTVRFLALLLIDPKPMQFLADTIRQEGKFVDYFFDNHGEEKETLVLLRDKFNCEHPERPIHLWELKWLLVNSAYAAATLKPMLNIVWQEEKIAPEQALYRHWDLFNQQMVILFQIEPQDILQPVDLNALLLPYECHIKNVKSLLIERFQ